MKKTGIVTDSNSGITEEEAFWLGIKVVPMPFTIDGTEYYEGITIGRDEFYKKLEEGADVKTSQPSPEMLMDIWDEMLQEYEEIVYIPMSSSLSSSVMTAKILAEDYYRKVCVVDNLRISCTQKMSVLEAVRLSELGYNALQIQNILERDRLNASIYIAVDTMKHLKRGGRVTPAGASVASMLNIKPILQIQGEELDAYAKARCEKSVCDKLLHAVEKDIEGRFHGKNVYIEGAYSCSEEKAGVWKKEIEKRFPDYRISMDPLALSIGCHVGEGAIAIGCMEELEEAPNINYQIRQA